ncbi:hypothetical protein N7452_001125 [Penicillium brevicompactum]|uniref:Deacetylase sirtuin-type domain-containing protein n=1 Tax=Penicillium brevicompactum TaxID=5074 RepID=A0A9W9URJ6_PENBR|nr:hypothetical protein N7452_001125 [Penicillium brevicompactum]
MASTARAIVPAADLQSFTEYLGGCKRILALLGAGISASSGLPTFRGAGGMWRSYDATSLATPEAFEENPGLVWQFYSYRRHMALQAEPNRAHYALAELARRNEEFVTLSQNVDGLSQRANHPSKQLHLLHGSLFDVKCSDFFCDYVRPNDFTDPIVPALDIPKKLSSLNPSSSDKTGEEASKAMKQALAADTEVDISDSSNPIPHIKEKDLPKCPKCKKGLLRPGVVWFGEALPEKTIDDVDKWIAKAPVDLCLVIGTSSKVYPAAGYVDEARKQGARVAVCNMDPNDVPSRSHKADWFFTGDAGAIVPEILKSVIGDI